MHEKPRVLVVDDELAPMRALRWELKPFEVVTAASMSEGLVALYAQPFDAVVCDWNLGIEGNAHALLEVARRLNGNTRRVIISGEVPEDLAALLISGVAHRYIAKPWGPHDLRTAVLEELSVS
jgi:DNA-binding NtrC family response regulator